MLSPKEAFKQRYEKDLKNSQLRKNFNNLKITLATARKKAYPDEEQFRILQNVGNRIKANAINNLADKLIELEKNCKKNGIHVHWAETVEEANDIVLEICQKHDAKKIIKGKSMVTEEMELNHFLEKHNIEALETDLGEYIIQLEHETPSHLIAPAIHRNKKQIAETFHQKIKDTPYTEVAEELNAIARKILRSKFFEADVGITGVNFAIAETGTICLVENEGNGRMCSTVPPVHIAVMGIEKVLSTLEEVHPILTLLTKSATGQPISTYFNMINSPRKPGEKDGPKEVHLLILDNKRSEIYQDPQLRQTLYCIRCAACLNHCPVYARIGGHAYKQVYSGPIGKILAPQMNGLHDAGGLQGASSLCGACAEVCPVKIPIPDLLLRLRYEAAKKENVKDLSAEVKVEKLKEDITWKAWETVHINPGVYRISTKAASFFEKLIPEKIGPMKNWSRSRALPKIAKKSLHQLMKKRGQANE